MEEASSPMLLEHLFRREAGRIVSWLIGLLGSHHLQLAEDAVQESMLRAAQSWRFHGIPEKPEAWLFRVAHNPCPSARPGRQKAKGLFRWGITRPAQACLSGAEGWGYRKNALACRQGQRPLALIWLFCERDRYRMAGTLQARCAMAHRARSARLADSPEKTFDLPLICPLVGIDF